MIRLPLLLARIVCDLQSWCAEAGALFPFTISDIVQPYLCIRHG
jgi:hypothetical protein